MVSPQSTEELSEILSNERGSVVPVGASTQSHFGNPLRSFDCAVDLKQLNRITEYVPADLTIHVEAGVTLGELRRTLAENRQFLPLDPWNGPTATMGGIASANSQGPYRACGSMRDWIIGMKVVEVNGKVSKTGGRVVKNVTGYDLAKLYTGSIGTLAIITEISLKVRARYERTVTAIARFETLEATETALGLIRTSSLQPVSCEWVGPEHEVWLRFGEHPRAIDWQLKNLPPAQWNVTEGPDEDAAWERLRGRFSALGPVVAKVVGLPTTMAEIVAVCNPSGWIAHALNGIVFMSVTNAADVDRIRTNHRVVVERAPLEVRKEVSTFGLSDAEYALMLRMKRAFDPEGRLNPGRHVDGER